MGAGSWGTASGAVGAMPCCIAACGPCLAWGGRGLLVISRRGLRCATRDGDIGQRRPCASPAAVGPRSQNGRCAPWCDTRSVTGLRPDPGLGWQQAHQLLLVPTLPCKHSLLRSDPAVIFHDSNGISPGTGHTGPSMPHCCHSLAGGAPGTGELHGACLRLGLHPRPRAQPVSVPGGGTDRCGAATAPTRGTGCRSSGILVPPGTRGKGTGGCPHRVCWERVPGTACAARRAGTGILNI